VLPQLREYLAAERVVGYHPVPQLLMPYTVPLRVAAHQSRLVNWVVRGGDDRGGVRPELEELPPAPEQRIEGGRIVVPETAPDDELMRSCDNVHRVQLQAPDIADEVEDAGLVGRRAGAR
jgi:hypothetical protein